ncbi:MAG: phosphate ABC transporter substrate-binding protein [Ignavibacterium sp.]|jgi:phosphate transport system substrate-binding protein
MKKTVRHLGLLFLQATLIVTAVGQTVQVDPKIPKYNKKEGVSGKISSIGSDTMNNLLALWGEAFKQIYPNVVIEFEGKGSSTAPPALLAGTAQLGPMSRPMKAEEMEAIERKYGFKPTAVNTAVDALAVYVHKDNPLESLTLQQLDAIFSKSRRGGYRENITNWSQIDPNIGNRPISLYGRNSASGTYGFFKEHALFRGDFKDGVKEQPGSAAVVQGVSRDRYGIGYSGIGYRTSGVKALAIAERAGARAYEPNFENAESGRYPIARVLFMYILKEPQKPLDPLLKEFLTYVLSFEGQSDVLKDGYYPLSYQSVMAERKKLD